MRARVTVLGGFVAVGVLFGWMIEQIHRRGPAAPAQAASGGAVLPELPSDGRASRRPTTLPKTPTPWAVRAESSPPVEKGYLPAWVVRPPTPERDPVLPPPRAVPDPMAVRPSLWNPNGVNGDRPPRAVVLEQPR